jgi:hypothetical protein
MDAMLRAELGVESVAAAIEAKAVQMANAEDVTAATTRAETMATLAESKPRTEEGTFAKADKPSGDVITTRRTGRGTSSEYLVRRLKRDAANPSATNHDRAKDALVKLQSGTITSARAAGIAGGIVRVPTALETILRLLPRLDRAGARADREMATGYLLTGGGRSSSSEITRRGSRPKSSPAHDRPSRPVAFRRD